MLSEGRLGCRAVPPVAWVEMQERGGCGGGGGGNCNPRGGRDSGPGATGT